MKKFIYHTGWVLGFLLPGLLIAQPSFQISLYVNQQQSARIYHDEPLLLTVSLSNPAAQNAQGWNRAADRGLQKLEESFKAGTISKEQYDTDKKKLTEGKKNVPAVTLGTAGKPWASWVTWKLINLSTNKEVSAGIIPLSNPTVEDMAVLDANGYYTGYFGMDPERTRGLAAGVYQMTAIVETVSSAPVRIEILNPALPAAVAGSDSMLLKLGQYYWHKSDAEKVIRYADRVLLKNPSSLDGLSLKGDGLLLQNAWAPALEAYQKALKEYYRQNGKDAEPPEYLLAMIGYIKKESGL